MGASSTTLRNTTSHKVSQGQRDLDNRPRSICPVFDVDPAKVAAHDLPTKRQANTRSAGLGGVEGDEGILRIAEPGAAVGDFNFASPSDSPCSTRPQWDLFPGLASRLWSG